MSLGWHLGGLFGANNQNACFNWFQPDDAARDRGEALSIAQMIDAMISKHPVDQSRVYIAGLSAGGAMTAAMLAAYPERFAGGAIVAGVPFGCADTVIRAFDCMKPWRRSEAGGMAEGIGRNIGEPNALSARLNLAW